MRNNAKGCYNAKWKGVITSFMYKMRNNAF